MRVKDIRVRGLTDDDFVEVSEWFTGRKWPVPPQGKMLPDSGYVAECDGVPLSVAWLYITNSNMGIIDWIATNPKSGAKGIISVKKLINHIEDLSIDAVEVFMHFTPNEKLARFLKRKCGFKIGDRNVNICIKRRAGAHG